MRNYVMEWSVEQRKIPLIKIDKIIEKFYPNGVQKYLLLRPVPKEILDQLKKSENINFLWDCDLSLRGSVKFTQEPSWVRFATVNDDCSVENLEKDYYCWKQYPFGKIIVTTNPNIHYDIEQPYLDTIDGPMLPIDFFEILFANGGKFSYEVTVASQYRNDLGGTDEFLFADEQILTDANLFHWSKIVKSTIMV
mgnify:CR=1 FL=1|jgi:hypothetical protein